MPFKLLFQQLCWWMAILIAAIALKHHYSIADARGLEWVFSPLALMLEWFTGFSFQQDANFEWVSVEADVRLVKACAGINFMIMSLLGYAWILRPSTSPKTGWIAELCGQALLLGAVLIAAWATCLLANCLRILIVMNIEHWVAGNSVLGLNANQLHRLTGMLVYIPLLSLQMWLGDAINRTHAYNRHIALIAPVILYSGLTVVVPILTGNAWHNPKLFAEHSLFVLVAGLIVAMLLIAKQTKEKHSLVRKRN